MSPGMMMQQLACLLKSQLSTMSTISEHCLGAHSTVSLPLLPCFINSCDSADEQELQEVHSKKLTPAIACIIDAGFRIRVEYPHADF
jgi:hypothetical protein